jgi:hypothetical protein
LGLKIKDCMLEWNRALNIPKELIDGSTEKVNRIKKHNYVFANTFCSLNLSGMFTNTILLIKTTVLVTVVICITF